MKYFWGWRESFAGLRLVRFAKWVVVNIELCLVHESFTTSWKTFLITIFDPKATANHITISAAALARGAELPPYQTLHHLNRLSFATNNRHQSKKLETPVAPFADQGISQHPLSRPEIGTQEADLKSRRHLPQPRHASDQHHDIWTTRVLRQQNPVLRNIISPMGRWRDIIPRLPAREGTFNERVEQNHGLLWTSKEWRVELGCKLSLFLARWYTSKTNISSGWIPVVSTRLAVRSCLKLSTRCLHGTNELRFVTLIYLMYRLQLPPIKVNSGRADGSQGDGLYKNSLRLGGSSFILRTGKWLGPSQASPRKLPPELG